MEEKLPIQGGSVLQLLTYQQQYFESLLTVINEADEVDEANLGTVAPELAHILEHQHPETVCLALVDASVAGFVRLETRPAADEKPASVVCLGIVHPSFRRQGIGTQLVRWAIERAKQIMQGEPFTFMLPVRHSVQGLQQLVESLEMSPGFFFHVLQYANLPSLPAEPQAIDGVAVRTYTSDADIAPYTNCLNQVFGQRTSEETVKQVTTEPAFDPAIWFFAFDQSRLVGFCTCTGYQREGEIEYLGVLPEYRGKGLGQALLSLGVRALAAKGYENIHLAVNVRNERALGIYKQVGFREWRRSTTYMLEFATIPNN